MDPLDPSLGRRDLLKLGGLAGLSWLAGPLLPRALAETGGPVATSLIVVWLDGGPSQLETFDPHAGTSIGGPTLAIPTKQKGVSFAADYPRLADRADTLAVIRSMLTREGEHTRGRYLLQTGFPLRPTVERPALSAVVAQQLEREALEIPRHVALLANHPPRGGYLGAKWNAFKIGDPKQPLPDLVSPVGTKRFDERLKHLALLEGEFQRGRKARLESVQHRPLVKRARRMMTSKQIKAFDYRQEPAALVAKYGDTKFGRSCLVARRLVETGVPAIQVTLSGWDTHVNNFGLHTTLAQSLDAGLSALLDDLSERKLLDSTLVLCAGEFGRTPRVNALGGRDHWTRGFSLLMAGGGVRPGITIGSTDPAGKKPPTDPVRPQDLFATIYQQFGIDGAQWFDTRQGRPAQLNKGKPIKGLIKAT